MPVYMGDMHLSFDARDRKHATSIMRQIADILEKGGLVSSAYFDATDIVPEQLGTKDEPTKYEG